MKRRGFIFTLDALISLILVMLFISAVVTLQLGSNPYSSQLQEQNQYTANDVLTILRTVPLVSLVPPANISKWKQDNTLMGIVDPKMSTLEIVATYWALDPIIPENLTEKAEIILSYVLEQLLRGEYYYELIINNYTSPYLRRGTPEDYLEAREVSVSTLTISGYALNQTPRGYMARAFLTRIDEKNAIFVKTGNGYLSNGTSMRIVEYIPGDTEFPPDANISNVKWVLEVVDGTEASFSFSIDGQLVNDDGSCPLMPLSNPNVVTFGCDLSRYINQTWVQHEFEININNPNRNLVGIRNHHIIINYTTRFKSTFEYINEYHYGDVAVENATVLTIQKTVPIPGLLKFMEVNLHMPNSGGIINSLNESMEIHINDMNNTEIFIGNKSDYNTADETLIWESSRFSAYFTNLSETYPWIIINLTASGPVNFTINGSNSYIALEYETAPIPVTLYSIDVVRFVENEAPGTCSWQFNVPEYGYPIWVRSYFGENQTVNVTIANWNTTSKEYVVVSPIFAETFGPGSNITVNGSCPDYALTELRYVIQAYAGYNDVFPLLARENCGNYTVTYYYGREDQGTVIINLPQGGVSCQLSSTELLANRSLYAIDDALVRLFENLGGTGTPEDPLLIKLPGVGIADSVSMGDIPNLYSPIYVTLRIWRESR